MNNFYHSEFFFLLQKKRSKLRHRRAENRSSVSNRAVKRKNDTNPEQTSKRQKGDSEHATEIQPEVKERNQFSELQSKMREKLEGSRFRWINEQLYTTSGSNALRMFQNNPNLFTVYHAGFKHQVTKWPSNPVDLFIKYIKLKGADLIVGDFGCGEAKIAQSVPNKVYSFDLQAANHLVTQCDMAHVPLKNSSIDLAIFSLSLMGTNYIQFIQEAHRVLKVNGTLKIAEVKSRIENISAFIEAVTAIGFQFVDKDENNKMFILFEFTKHKGKPQQLQQQTILKPCKYKKR